MLFSCGNKEDKSKIDNKAGKLTIEGKFENGVGKTIFLEKIESESFISLDTAIINKKGEFSFKTSTLIPQFFKIRTEQGQFIVLLLYGQEKVKIRGDYNNFKDYSVEGSPETEKIRQLSVETNNAISLIDGLHKMANDSTNSPNYSSIRVKSNEEFQNIMNDLKQYSLNFIKENSGSLIGLIALYSQVGPQMMVFHPVQDMPVYEKVDSSLSAVYPDLPLVKSLHQSIATIKAQIAAQQQQTAPGVMPNGTVVPDISLPSPDGIIIKLSSLKGKIVLLDFWASWCQPCRHENPTLVENYSKYHASGFEIYQVSLDRTRQDWINGINQDNLNWTHVSDLKYWQSSVVPQFRIQGIPMNYLLDKDGKVIASNLRGPALGEKLQEIFNK
jgi:thiol-disulfide isomerase/thioredoxin